MHKLLVDHLLKTKTEYKHLKDRGFNIFLLKQTRKSLLSAIV